MNKYKKIIFIGLIGAMILSTVACSGQKNTENVENTAPVENTEKTKPVENAEKAESSEKPETVSEAATDEKDSKEYEFYEINQNPQILKEFTNMDADYAGYLKSMPFRALFLDKEGKITDEIRVYTLPENKESIGLYIYEKNHKVIDAKLDEFNGDVNIEGYDYDTILYNYDNNIENQIKDADFPYDLLNKAKEAEKELKGKFEGKDLKELHDFLKVYVPVQKYVTKDTDKVLEVYAVVSEFGYTVSSGINVIVKDDKIEKLYIDEINKKNHDPIETLKSAK